MKLSNHMLRKQLGAKIKFIIQKKMQETTGLSERAEI